MFYFIKKRAWIYWIDKNHKKVGELLSLFYLLTKGFKLSDIYGAKILAMDQYRFLISWHSILGVILILYKEKLRYWYFVIHNFDDLLGATNYDTNSNGISMVWITLSLIEVGGKLHRHSSWELQSHDIVRTPTWALPDSELHWHQSRLLVKCIDTYGILWVFWTKLVITLFRQIYLLKYFVNPSCTF